MGLNEAQAATLRAGLTIGLGLTPMGPWGYILGSAVGTFLFRTDPPKPNKIREYGLHQAQEGIPIPLSYGTNKMNCNYVWKGPLTRSSIKSGSKGGKKHTTGYKYYFSAAAGICRGKAEVSRVWKDNNINFFQGSGSLSLYRGTADQAVDTTLSTEIDNPSPYRGLCYGVWDASYMGKNSAQVPVYQFETHRYPFNVNAGDWSRIYERYDDTEAIGGVTLKDSFGRMIVVKRDNVLVYDRTMTNIVRTISLSAFSIPVVGSLRYFDADLIETGKYQWLYIVYNDASNHVKAIRVNIGTGKVASTTTNTWSIKASASNMAGICHNSDYMFVGYRVGAASYFKKYSLNNLDTALAEYTITGDLGTPFEDITCNDDYVFICDEDKLYSYNDTGTLKDSVAHSYDDPKITCLRGGDEVLMHMFKETVLDDAIKVFTYAEADGTLTVQEQQTVENMWSDGSSPFSAEPLYHGLYAAPDGTLIISGENVAADEQGTQHIIMSSVPSQIIYDLWVNERERSEDTLDLTVLQAMSAYCVTNKIGMCFALTQENTLVSILQQILNAVQGIGHVGSDGKWRFPVFQNADASKGTLDEDDLLAAVIRDGNIRNFTDSGYGSISQTIKNKQQRANRFNVQYVNRLNNYKVEAFPVDNFLAQQEDGELIEQSIDATMFSYNSVAARMANRAMKFSEFDTDICSVPLMPKWLSLQPGDKFVLNVPDQQFDSQTMRVLAIDDAAPEAGEGVLAICRKDELFLNTFEEFDLDESDWEDTSVKPPTDVRPFVVEFPAPLNDDMYALGFCGVAYDADTIGFDVWRMEDDGEYELIGTSYALALAGDIAATAAEGDKQITVNFDDYISAFSSVTVEEQRNNRSFCVLGEFQADSGEIAELEFASFRSVAASGGDYILNDCTRGRYYTIDKAHDTDGVVLLIGVDRFFKWTYPESKIGKEITIKLVALGDRNIEQDFDDVASYTYTIQGFTRKATPTSGLEIRDGGAGRGSLIAVNANDVTVQWRATNRNSGVARTAAGAYVTGEYVDGDVDTYDLLVYDSSKVYVTTREEIGYSTDGDDLYYEYTEAMNTADFAGLTKSFYLGLRPSTPRGFVDDVEMHKIKLNT